ncbi:MAG TPA: hypothetical protein VGL34_27250 [Steroidobacteraceae bacterium]
MRPTEKEQELRNGRPDVAAQDRIRKVLGQKYAAELFKVLETEILSLHDGNIARFRIRPAEFEEWKRAQ